MPEQADAAKPVVVQALTDEEILARLLSSRPEPSVLERERGFDRVMRRVDAESGLVALPAIAAGVALAAAGVALWLWSSPDVLMASDTGESRRDLSVWWGGGNTSPDETPSSQAALEIPPVESSDSVVDFLGLPSEQPDVIQVESGSSALRWTPGPDPSFALLCSDVASGTPPVEPPATISCSQDARLSFAIETPRDAPYVAVMGAQPQKPLLWLLPASGEETPYKSHWFTSQYSIALAELPAGEYEITLAFFEHPIPRTEVVQQLRKRESAHGRVLTRKLTVTPGRAKAPASPPTIPRSKSKGPPRDRNQSMGF